MNRKANMNGNNFFRRESEYERVQHETNYQFEKEHNKLTITPYDRIQKPVARRPESQSLDTNRPYKSHK